ncbi:MAG: hypothetical protein ACM3N5_00815 [Candidatus Eiseniibacteriota bacterium]
MSLRWIAVAAAFLALAGCVDHDYPLWTPVENENVVPGGPPLANPGTPPNRPTLDYGDRRWQGGEPSVYQPPQGQAAPSGNQVLAPTDPNSPYSAMGGGYQRQGTTIIGPTGDTHSIVGSTVFGPTGRACSVVGQSLFCN